MMARRVRHFSLHRIVGTELRVVSDVDAGVIPLIQAEEEVIRGYVERAVWPHRGVTLFILQDLQPLARHVPRGAGLPPGGPTALEHRPVVNVYDLADPAICHVFVNQKAMTKEGYWDDRLAMRGLLAHEHAHPLAENDATRASRRLKVELSWRMEEAMALGVASLKRGSQADPGEIPASTLRSGNVVALSEQWQTRVDPLLALLVDTLCVYAPREIFANEVTIRSGFAAALLHLNQRNIVSAIRSLEDRPTLLRHLQEDVNKGTLPRPGIDLLMLIGDMKGYLDMALEVAPFYRAGREVEALELEAGLQAAVFPALEPEVAAAYQALRDQYIALPPDASTAVLIPWGQAVVQTLAVALQGKALDLRYRVTADA